MFPSRPRPAVKARSRGGSCSGPCRTDGHPGTFREWAYLQALGETPVNGDVCLPRAYRIKNGLGVSRDQELTEVGGVGVAADSRGLSRPAYTQDHGR